MNEISTKNDSTGKYLIVPAPEQDTDFEMEMIDNLKDRNILKPIYVYENERKCCSYNVTGYINFESYMFRESFDLEDIRAIMVQINNAVRRMLDFLLGEENLLIRKDCIFVDVNTRALKFCAYPGNGRNFSNGLKEILQDMLLSVDTNDTDAVNLTVRLYRTACESDSGMYDVINTMLMNKSAEKTPVVSEIRTSPSSLGPSNDIKAANAEATQKPVNGRKTGFLSKAFGGFNKGKERTKSNSDADADTDFKALQEPATGMKTTPELKEDAGIRSALDLETKDLSKITHGDLEEGSASADLDILDLDDLDLDDYEDDTTEAYTKEKSKPSKGKWGRLIVAQCILAAVMVILYLVRGSDIVSRLIPLYAILAVCLTVYIFAQDMSAKKKQKGIRTGTSEQIS